MAESTYDKNETESSLSAAMQRHGGSALQDNRKLSAPLQRNNTGLPDDLKSGMENLSGISLDQVKVHYNSSKPAAVQAHAYAQGSNIHLAPGQERHLPHELGHVVQQAQGRVNATTNVAGVAINDDNALEKEADNMGEQALQMRYAGPAKLPAQHLTTWTRPVAQLVSFRASRATALEFPENTDVNFPGEVQVFTGGFDDNEELQNVGIKYLYEYSRRIVADSDVPAYQGQNFNATLPIDADGGMGHFSFEFSNDNTRASVFYRGNANVEDSLVNIDGGVQNVVQRLQQEFGISSVDNGNADWTKPELIKMYSAFSMLPAQERAVLQGLALERVAAIANQDEGMHTLAHFTSVIDSDAVEVLSRKIVVSNRAFQPDAPGDGQAASFALDQAGNVIPASFQTILHETAHGVEKLSVLARGGAHAQAIKDRNLAVIAHNPLVGALNEAVQQKNAAMLAWQQFENQHSEQLAEQRDAIDTDAALEAYNQRVVQANQLNQSVVNLVNAHAPNQELANQIEQTLAATELAGVIAAGGQIIQLKRNVWQGQIPANYNEQMNQLWAAFQAATTAVANEAHAHYQQLLDQRNVIVGRANSLIQFNNTLVGFLNENQFEALPDIPDNIADLNVAGPAQHYLDTSRIAHERRQAFEESEQNVAARTQTRDARAAALNAVSSEDYGSNRLQNFVRFVNANELQPTDADPLTAYALRSWQQGNWGEFFAEAYSLFLTNPRFLLAQKPNLYQYFHANVQRRDNLVNVEVGDGQTVITDL